MEAKHTATPWECDLSIWEYGPWVAVKCDEPRVTVAHVYKDENAQFIVRACNNYEALVDALTKARSMLARGTPATPDDLHEFDAVINGSAT